MSITLEIQISQSSENNSISPREPIIAIVNGDETIVNDASPHRNSVESRLKTIEAETPPRFKFRWKPPDKYKSLFPSLKKKGNKELSKIYFTFFIRDDGNIIWDKTAVAEGCEILQAPTKGRDAAQEVEVKCSKFEPSKTK
jgi:hypothetical protein